MCITVAGLLHSEFLNDLLKGKFHFCALVFFWVITPCQKDSFAAARWDEDATRRFDLLA